MSFYIMDFLMAAINIPLAVRGYKLNIDALSFWLGVGLVHLEDSLK